MNNQTEDKGIDLNFFKNLTPEEHAKLSEKLKSANLSGANLNYINASGVNLNNVNANGANITEVRDLAPEQQEKLREAIEKTCLKDVDLSNYTLKNADFRGTLKNFTPEEQAKFAEFAKQAREKLEAREKEITPDKKEKQPLDKLLNKMLAKKERE